MQTKKDNKDIKLFEGNLQEVFLILVQQVRIVILTPTILCTVVIIYALFFTERYYTSTAKIMSSKNNKNNSGAMGIAAQFGINLPLGQSNEIWVYPEILKSRAMARTILNRNFDTKKFGSQKSLMQIKTYGKNDRPTDMTIKESLAVDKFIKSIDIKEDRTTGIFSLSTSSFEPELAANIITALIQELDTHQKEHNKAIASKTRHFIDDRIITVEKDLRNAEESLRDFTISNRRIENSPLLLLEQERLSREVTVLTGVFTMLKQQLETAKIEEVKESNYVIIIDPPEIPVIASGPNRRKMVIFSGFLGLFFGVLIALLVNVFQEHQKRIKSIFDLTVKNLF